MSKRYSRDDLITEISKDTNIKRSAVKIIIESFINISIREIVLKGDFLVKDLFSVSSSTWKSYETSDGQIVPEHKRLNVRLSGKIKRLFKHQQKLEKDRIESPINEKNWRQALEYYENAEKQEKKQLFNPFIDDFDDFDNE